MMVMFPMTHADLSESEWRLNDAIGSLFLVCVITNSQGLLLAFPMDNDNAQPALALKHFDKKTLDESTNGMSKELEADTNEFFGVPGIVAFMKCDHFKCSIQFKLAT
jgi:hypothetical protein